MNKKIKIFWTLHKFPDYFLFWTSTATPTPKPATAGAAAGASSPADAAPATLLLRRRRCRQAFGNGGEVIQGNAEDSSGAYERASRLHQSDICNVLLRRQDLKSLVDRGNNVKQTYVGCV